ncbi:MAG TPA: sensor histidine kinase [Verrucomicrobiae bacterium]|nr:sensor histidine kinase [Verrucomicrobiae bacterium]
MLKWIKFSGPLLLALWAVTLYAANEASTNDESGLLEIRSVSLSGKAIPLHGDAKLNLGRFPENVVFGFGPSKGATRVPVRLRYKLEGFDTQWHEGDSEMHLAVRFNNDAGDQVFQKIYPVSGYSAGWQGELTNSFFTHRRETLVVPPQASRVLIVIASAGPPTTVGVYVVQGLVVSRLGADNHTEVLLKSPFSDQGENESDTAALRTWARDGLQPSMAKIVDVGQDPTTKAFALFDDDPFGHCEWHNLFQYAPRVKPGDHLVVEWNEMFCMGSGDVRSAIYPSLPPGKFQFRLEELNLMGVPTGVETSLAVIVPQPYWKEPWYWVMISLAVTLILIVISRYFISQKLRREMMRLENQRMLGQERLRIAHDIHDDLGARVTQISLLSAMAHDNLNFPEKARADFDQISRMSRDLVSALYETVWAVNPDNDNLDALGNYICQMVNQLCSRAHFGCRFHMQDLPREVEVSSQTRHNISMVVKEAVHNVIKHAKASEVTVSMAFTDGILTASVHDDGCGFKLGESSAGNGLTNMKQRLEDIGGTCWIESAPGKGTTVHVRLRVKPLS